MKPNINSLLVVLFIVACFHNASYSQNNFVEFETSRTHACQGMPFVVVANVHADGYKGMEWSGSAIKKANGEVISVNTQNAGEVSLSFRLITGTGKYIDTTLTIAIMPSPLVALKYQNQILSVEGASIASYTWIYNREATEDHKNSPISNPKAGSYSIYAKDGNGCATTTKPLVIK